MQVVLTRKFKDEVITEIVTLISEEDTIYRLDGIKTDLTISKLVGDTNSVVFEDEFGLFFIFAEDIISIEPVKRGETNVL